VALSLGRLRLVLGQSDKFEEEEQVKESAVTLWRSLVAANYTSLLQQMHNLACTKDILRKYDDTESLLVNVIEA
jgi:hypothetical protein